MLHSTDHQGRATLGQHANTQGEPVAPLCQRAIEIDVAEAFVGALRERSGDDEANAVLASAVERLAGAAAASWRERLPAPTLADLWDVWGVLGGDGRLDLHLDELTEHVLRFHVDHCAYADLYRSRGQEEIGIAFSCRRDAPFARALIPGVRVEQSETILEGSTRCEFAYMLEDE